MTRENTINMRKHRRSLYFSVIDYMLSGNNGNCDHNVYKGLVLNISSSGTSFCVFRPLKVGQQLKVMNDPILDDGRYKTVRWVKKVGENMYNVGLTL
jgi:hypothetical protein